MATFQPTDAQVTHHIRSGFTSHDDEEIEEVEEEEAGYICQFFVSEVRQQPETFEELLTELNDTSSSLRSSIMPHISI